MSSQNLAGVVRADEDFYEPSLRGLRAVAEQRLWTVHPPGD
jgi:hypothetical protein